MSELECMYYVLQILILHPLNSTMVIIEFSDHYMMYKIIYYNILYDRPTSRCYENENKFNSLCACVGLINHINYH